MSHASAWRPAAAWIAYDLANTAFSLNMVSLYFPIWIVSQGATDFHYGLVDGLAMLAVALVAPLLGALSDAAPRRVPLLVGTTVACVALTAVIGFLPVWVALGVFALANGLYNVGLIFYDALLPEVSTPANRGRVGGLGVGVGYVGSFLGIGVGGIVLAWRPDAYAFVFLATAVIFLAFALPCFFLVRERPRARRPLGNPFRALAKALRDTRDYPGLRRFLVGRFFFADAANTLILFMGIYVTHEVGFDAGTTRLLLAAAIAAAIVGGIAVGVLVDRRGPKRALYLVMSAWVVVFTLVIAVPVLDLPKNAFWIAAVLAGASLGGTWAADRPFMLRLTPPARVGEFYGLYAMAGRFSAVVGPLLWAGIYLWSEKQGWVEYGRPAAVGALLVMVIVAMIVLRKVDDGSGAASREARPEA